MFVYPLLSTLGRVSSSQCHVGRTPDDVTQLLDQDNHIVSHDGRRTITQPSWNFVRKL